MCVFSQNVAGTQVSPGPRAGVGLALDCPGLVWDWSWSGSRADWWLLIKRLGLHAAVIDF